MSSDLQPAMTWMRKSTPPCNPEPTAMTSETKVPMPAQVVVYRLQDDEKYTRPFCIYGHTSEQLAIYGSARASERDAFWIAKVAELERIIARQSSVPADPYGY